MGHRVLSMNRTREPMVVKPPLADDVRHEPDARMAIRQAKPDGPVVKMIGCLVEPTDPAYGLGPRKDGIDVRRAGEKVPESDLAAGSRVSGHVSRPIAILGDATRQAVAEIGRVRLCVCDESGDSRGKRDVVVVEKNDELSAGRGQPEIPRSGDAEVLATDEKHIVEHTRVEQAAIVDDDILDVGIGFLP
jgi:hypothetical protein